MKEENMNQKNKNEDKSFSPSSQEKESDKNLSPTMNQKYFPSKEEFFGKRTNRADISLSPTSHSPILNYYSSYSPENQDFYFSNNNNSNKLSPNFDYSPSTIFNAPKNCKDGANFQNFTLHSSGNNEEDSKTLQEKMDPFFRTDAQNFLRRGSSLSNKQENKKDEEDDDEDENEAYI